MTCYRVVRRKYANLSGEGARLYGGRFNPPGIPAVYSSQNIALTLLEILVHVDNAAETRPILRVPSVIVPREYNYVLFPEADGFDASIAWTEPLNFDSRLLSFVEDSHAGRMIGPLGS